MKILFVTHNGALRGANLSMLQLMRELRDNHGVEICVVVPKHSSTHNLVQALQKEGFSHYVLPHIFWFKYYNRYRAVRKWLLSLLPSLYLVWKLRKEHFDIVHSNGSVIDLGAIIARIYHKPHVWHLREFGKKDFNLVSIFGKHYDRLVYKKGCDIMIAISQCVADEYTKDYGPLPIKVVYNGIIPKDKALFAEHRSETTQICCVGVISQAKNQKEVLEAACLLINKMNVRNIHLTFIGAVGEKNYYDDMQEYIQKENLNEHITFTGEINNVPQVLSTMDIGIIPSKCEAFGRVTVEFMLQKLAVIGSNSGANPEIIKNGKNGSLYTLGKASDLAEKLHAIVTDRSKFLNYAEQGYITAINKFTSKKNSDDIFNVYSEYYRK